MRDEPNEPQDPVPFELEEPGDSKEEVQQVVDADGPDSEAWPGDHRGN